jgi:hypothetical protein
MVEPQAPQTLSSLLAPYLPLVTPVTLLALAWKAARLITKIEDRAEASEKRVSEIHQAVTNDMPHCLEEIRNEIHGQREDMKLMFQARTALDSQHHEAH